MFQIALLIFLFLSSVSCHPVSSISIQENRPLERSWPIMGTIFSIQLWSGDKAAGFGAMEEAFERVKDVDQKMSTYRPESEISFINQRAGQVQPVAGSSSILDVIHAGLEVGKESNGAFDITIGPLVALWTFYSPWKGEERKPPLEQEIGKSKKLLGLPNVWMDRSRHLVRLEKTGMKLDLNGIAKGYALDQAAQVLKKWKIESALLDLGGQVLVLGHPPDGKEWKIGIRDPKNSSQTIKTLSIERGSVSTSGDYERFFVYRGKRYAHILDPRSGWPVDHTWAVTVWAPTGMMADSWSTALFVLGFEKGKTFIKKHSELGAIWIDSNGIHVAGALEGSLN